MPYFPFVSRGIINFYIEFSISSSDSITKFGCEVNIKSIQEEKSPIICASSLIVCCNPSVEVILSILEALYVVLPPLNQRFNSALKSPRTEVTKVLLTVAVSIFDSKLFANT